MRQNCIHFEMMDHSLKVVWRTVAAYLQNTVLGMVFICQRRGRPCKGYCRKLEVAQEKQKPNPFLRNKVEEGTRSGNPCAALHIAHELSLGTNQGSTVYLDKVPFVVTSVLVVFYNKFLSIWSTRVGRTSIC